MPAAAPRAESRRVTSPLPRTTTRGTRSGRPTSASAPACPGVGTSCTASAGTPFSRRDGAITSSTRAVALPSAAAPVRSTAALRALSTWDATSIVTFGRASNTAPITPTGTRRSNTRSPVGRVRTKRCSAGSGVSASTSSWTAMSASRSGVSRSRSSRPPVMPPRSAASTSAAFAASRSAVRSRSAAAIVRRAASTAGPPAERTPGAAPAARCAAARTAACSGVSAVSATASLPVVLTVLTASQRAMPSAGTVTPGLARACGSRRAARPGAGTSSGCRGAADGARSGHGARRVRPAPRRRRRCRCSAGSPGRTGRRR